MRVFRLVLRRKVVQVLILECTVNKNVPSAGKLLTLMDKVHNEFDGLFDGGTGRKRRKKDVEFSAFVKNKTDKFDRGDISTNMQFLRLVSKDDDYYEKIESKVRREGKND